MEGYDARTYGEAYADVYDDWYDWPGLDDAVRTVADLAGGGRILELAVGTGRLAHPLAEAGHAVVGVDASTAMLDELRAKPSVAGLRPVQADMARLPFGGSAGSAPFGLAFVAVNSFFNLFTEADQVRCLVEVARVLEPGGRLAVEAFVPDDRASGRGVVEPRTIDVDRVTLFVSQNDPDEQTIRGQIVELSAEATRLRPIFLRYLWPEQLDDLARGAGLALEHRWADWSRAAFTDDAPGHVSVYHRTPS